MKRYRTKEAHTSRIMYTEFVVPAGVEVRQLRPDECPTHRAWVVVNPLVDIKESQSDALLRHDLVHRYVFVPQELIEEYDDGT